MEQNFDHRLAIELGLFTKSFAKKEKTVVAPGWVLENPEDVHRLIPAFVLTDLSRFGLSYSYDSGVIFPGVALTAATGGATTVSWYDARARLLLRLTKNFYLGPILGLGSIRASGTSAGTSVYGGIDAEGIFHIKLGVNAGFGMECGYSKLDYSYRGLATTVSSVDVTLKGTLGYSF